MSYPLNMSKDFIPMCILSETSQGQGESTQPVKQSDAKRSRRDRGELEDTMFKLFERQPNRSLKQLVQEIDQPAVWFPFHRMSVEDTGGEYFWEVH